MKRADVIVVGAGLAGLSCALELTSRRRGVLLLEGGRVVGGRTSSWDEGGMMVESGLHRVLGFYAAFPDLLRKAGLNVDDIVCWEDEIEIRLPDGHGSGVFGTAPFYNPIGTLTGILGNFEVLSLLDRISLAGFLTAGLLEYFSNPTALDQVSVSGAGGSVGGDGERDPASAGAADLWTLLPAPRALLGLRVLRHARSLPRPAVHPPCWGVPRRDDGRDGGTERRGDRSQG